MITQPHSCFCFAAGPARNKIFLEKALHRLSGCSAFMLLHSGGFPDPLGKWEWLLAAGAETTFTRWDSVPRNSGKWLFGNLNYEACRQTGGYSIPAAALSRNRPAKWPALHFFHPQILISCQRGSEEISVEIFSEVVPDAPTLYAQIEAFAVPPANPLPQLEFQKDLAKADYLKTVESLRRHIWEGDCYELNLCNYRQATTRASPNPVDVWAQLLQSSPAPFGMLYKLGHHWAAGVSPERYLRVEGNTVWSQPIKGTAPRGATPSEDEASKKALQHCPKEQAENVMIVDLTRSDLARVCEVGSVEVEELFGVYTFPKVHQLISTVRGKLSACPSRPFGSKTVFDAIVASFPMGSMTGAPREKVMELIDRYEARERGLFSGTVGYIDPAGNADFGVVIRTVFGDFETVHFNTGGAVTWHSNPEAEWAEMCLKGQAIESLFGLPASC